MYIYNYIYYAQIVRHYLEFLQYQAYFSKILRITLLSTSIHSSVFQMPISHIF